MQESMRDEGVEALFGGNAFGDGPVRLDRQPGGRRDGIGAGVPLRGVDVGDGLDDADSGGCWHGAKLSVMPQVRNRGGRRARIGRVGAQESKR